MTSLYPVTARMSSMLAVIVDNGGEVPPEYVAEWDVWFKHIADNEPEFLQDIVSGIEQLNMEAVASRASADQWRARAESREKAIARAKADILRYLEISGQKKAAIADGRVVCSQTNGGLQAIVFEDPLDPNKLAPAFQRHRVEVDTDAVRAVLEAGRKLPFAALQPRGKHVRIR